MKKIVFSQGIKIEMFKTKKNILDNSGQTLVEYLLLTLLVVGIMSGVWKTGAIQELIGPRGAIITKLNQMMRFSYRHAMSGSVKESYSNSNYTSPLHRSYGANGSTRFFGPAQEYPR